MTYKFLPNHWRKRFTKTVTITITGTPHLIKNKRSEKKQTCQVLIEILLRTDYTLSLKNLWDFYRLQSRSSISIFIPYQTEVIFHYKRDQRRIRLPY